jgi:hypothetical protein
MDRRALVIGLLWDVGLPVAGYALSRLLGAPAAVALLVGGLTAVLRTGVVAVLERRFDGVAAFLAVTFGVLVGVWAVTGDERIMLARESIVSGGLGLLLLGSCVIGRPLMYAAVRRLHAGDVPKLDEFAARWSSDPGFRGVFTTLSLVWGVGLLAEALVRIPLIYLLPVDLGYAASMLLQVATVASLLLWTVWRGRSRRAVAAGG